MLKYRILSYNFFYDVSLNTLATFMFEGIYSYVSNYLSSLNISEFNGKKTWFPMNDFIKTG